MTARSEAFWVALGQACLLFGALILVRVQTELLSPLEYARLALAMTVFSFGQVAIFGGLNHTITRLYALAGRRGARAAYRRIARRRFVQIATAWSALLGTAAATLWLAGWATWSALLVLVLLYSLLNGGLSALIAMSNAARHRRLVALHQASDAMLKVALVLLVAQAFAPSVAMLFIAYASASLIVLISLTCWVRHSLTPSPANDSDIDGIFGRFSKPIYLWSPFTWGLLVADRWALQTFAGAYALGLYAVASQMTLGPARITMTALLRYLSPRLFDRLEATGAEPADGLRRALICALILTLAGFAIATLFHGWIFYILVAPDYRAASPLLPWLVLAAGLGASGELVVLRLFGAMNSAALIRPRIATAVLGILLIFGGAWSFGLWGVVAAQVIQSGAFLIWALSCAGFWKVQNA